MADDDTNPNTPTTGSTPPVDDQLVLPEQVRRQAERANELLAGVTETEAPVEQAQEIETVELTPPPVHDTWEQRYRTLQGKYDSEIPGLRGQIAGLERVLATMQTPQPQAQPQQPQGVNFEEGDVDVYGQDFLEAAARAAAARYEPVIAELRSQITQLQGGQQTQSNLNLQERMFAALNKDPSLAGWEQVNTDPRFHAWLNEVDEYSGISRNQMLQHAYVNEDVPRVARFFRRYMTEHTVPQPTVVSPQTGIARPNGNGQMVAASGTRLEDMVVPGRAAGPGGSGNGAQNSRIWSRSEITRFYQDRTNGKFKGREDEALRLENDLFAAEREGRIH